MAEQAKTTKTTTGRRTGTPTRTYEEPVQVTVTEATEAARDVTSRATEPTPSIPPPSPRTDVAMNVETVQTAFASGAASQSVGYVQHVLRSRGFDPGSPTGIADRATREAYARFQDSINEAPTGMPTAGSLDYLGFDVIG